MMIIHKDPSSEQAIKETLLPLPIRVPIWFPSMALAHALYGRRTGALPIWRMDEERGGRGGQEDLCRVK